MFLVVGDKLEIEFVGWRQVNLTEWRGINVLAGMVHRTRAVTVTFETH